MLRRVAAGLTVVSLVFAITAVPQDSLADAVDCGQPPRPLVSVAVDRPDEVPWVATTVGIEQTRTLSVRAELRCGGSFEIGEVGVEAVLGDSVQGLWVLLSPPDPALPNLLTGSLVVRPSDLDNASAGLMPVTFRAGTIDYDSVKGQRVIGTVYEEMSVNTVHIYRKARLAVKVTPTRVKVGKSVTVTGRLTRADWDTGVYRGYARRQIRLSYWEGVGGCEDYKTVTSGPDGRFKTTFKPHLDRGPLKGTFDGNSTTGRIESNVVEVQTTNMEPCA